MKKGFPHKFLGLIPVGWKDLDWISETEKNQCKFCNGKHLFNIHLARQGGETFTYCKDCLLITSRIKNDSI